MKTKGVSARARSGSGKGFSLRSRARRAIPGLVLLLVPVLCYLPALRAGFVWDDRFLLTENPLMRLPDGLFRIWFSTASYDYYPVTYSAFWAGWQWWGANPLGFHAANIALNALNGFLLWRVLLRLQIPGAWLAALVFAVHPVNAASVAWISEMKNTLSMAFYLGAALSFFGFEDSSNKRAYAAAAGLFVLALLSKASVVMLPPVLLLCAWWRRGSISRTDVLRTAPLFLLSLLAGLVAIWFQSHNVINDQPVPMGDWWARGLRAAWAVSFYAGKLLFPVHLSLLYPHWEVDASLRWILPGALTAAVILAAVRFRRKWGRAVVFAAGYFCISLLPVLGFVKMYYFRLSPVADQWLYLPGIGVIALAVAAGWSLAPRARIPATIAAGVLVCLLAAMTWRRATLFGSVETLWSDVLRNDPGSATALINLSLDRLSRGRKPEALDFARRAAAVTPPWIEAQMNLGAVLDANGLLAESVQAYQKAVSVAPNLSQPHHELAIAYQANGEGDAAFQEYEMAVRLSPRDFQCRLDLGAQFFSRSLFDKATGQFQNAVWLNPSSANAHNSLGATYHSMGHLKEAEAEYRMALKLNPGHRNATENLAALLRQRD